MLSLQLARTFSRILAGVAVVLLSLCFSRIATAQVDQGQIAGTVKDSTESVVPGAKVTVRSAATGVVRSADTGVNGNYVLTNLPVGFYEIAVEPQDLKSICKPS